MEGLAKHELYKWVNQLDVTTLSEHDLTIINIIIKNFDEIATVGTAGGKRAGLIRKYIVEQKCKTDIEIINIGELESVNSDTIAHIAEMQIESFRGFVNKIIFDFSKQYTFLYGPNGAGKSSMCEALEYGLLGTIEEANTRRINVDKYIENRNTGKAKKPIISCKYIKHQDIRPGIANYDRYKFAFIEKNRIDKFSHIDATTGKSQSERLAALFGLSEFSDFINGFTDGFDGRYIKLESEIEKEYEKKKVEVEQYNKRNLEIISENNEAKTSESELIQQLTEKDIVTLEDAILYLKNSENGIIPELYNNINSNKINEIDIGWVVRIEDEVKEISVSLENVAKYEEKLMDTTIDLDMHNLYTIVNQIENNHDTSICPVCKTPIEDVVINPFENARNALLGMKLVDDIKIQMKEYSGFIKIHIFKINQLLLQMPKTTGSFSEVYESFCIDEIETEYFIKKSEIREKVRNRVAAIKNMLSKRENIVESINSYNLGIREKNKKNGNADKLAFYNEIYEKLIVCRTRNEAIFNEKKRIDDGIVEFEKNNTVTLEKISKEKEEISFNMKMVNSYEKVRRILSIYKDKLPLDLAENLSEKVTEYYNFINYDDADFEIVERFTLPKNVNEKINIKFKDGIVSDALQVLSEGHIKILGLAILLSKASQENINFMIFDDIVNAIDDDHRDGVAGLLMCADDFIMKQIIITCHGDQFITKLEEKIEISQRNKKINRYCFLPADCLEERGVVIKYAEAKEPLTIARDKYGKNELKESAAKCRQATESIVNRLWKKLSEKYSCEIAVALRGPKTIPDLNSIVTGLITATNKKKMSGAEEINSDLVKLKDSYNWMLLNKGTHFEDNQKEFERADIRRLIELLEKLDKKITDLKVNITVSA